MDYYSDKNGARTDGDQIETGAEFRVSYESPTNGLYVIRIPGGPCKIGMTRDLRRRLCEMQTHHPYDLEVVCWLPNKGHEELAWHHCFDEHRIRGEWFRWVPEISLAIEIACEGGDWTEVAVPPPELLAEITEHDGHADYEHGRTIYRTLLKRWAGDRGKTRRVYLPPRANTPVMPKSPGPVPKHRRAAEIERLNALSPNSDRDCNG